MRPTPRGANVAMSVLRVFAAILATAALAGCAAPARREAVEAAVQEAIVLPVPPASAPAPPPPPAGAPYKLASGDKLRIIVFGQADLTNTYSVDASGAVSMPLIGRVPAKGQTTDELERTVASRLRQGYLRDPSVSIEIADFRPFFIMGAVACAGQYPFVVGLTVEQAVAVAGGFAPGAVEPIVDVTRTNDGRSSTFAAPLAYPVRPGDTITVQARAY